MFDYLILIQARLYSTRLPNKVMLTVGGIPMVKRVWLAAKRSGIGKVIVAWPERYPDLDERNVLARFRRISNEFPSKYIIRLTADCPLLTEMDISNAVRCFETNKYGNYYSNHSDGHDVQVFTRDCLFGAIQTSVEHVIADFSTKPTGLSVNTQYDLDRVRALARFELK